MARANVLTDEFAYDDDDPPGYRAGAAHVGRSAGGVENIVKAYEIPAGERLCPYHYEYVEEWLLVLSGTLELRTPAGTETLGAGDLVCFPAGAAGAHAVANRGEHTARAVMFSSAREPAVAVYPDSGKVGVWAGDEADEFMFRRGDGAVAYYDGED